MAVPRHVTLIRAMRDLMREAGRGPHVKSIFECTATWDDAECDGHCLLEELNEWLDDIASAPTDDLAAENARLRSANTKLVEALKSVTMTLARREGLSMLVAKELIAGRWHEDAPNSVHCNLEAARAAIAEAEAQP